MRQKPSLRRHLAIVPAAGRSRRMGKSKSLLPWGHGSIIDAVLCAWTDSCVDRVVVVVRRDDQPLRDACGRWEVDVVTPEVDPPDMKASIQVGLKHLAPFATARDRCFIAPADLPTLSAKLIDSLAATESDRIVVPKFGDRDGHPILIPWPLTKQVFDLGPDQGVNRIVDHNEKLYVSMSAENRVMDVDTPEQYQQLRRKVGKT